MITTTQTVGFLDTGSYDTVEFTNSLPEIPSMDLGSCFYISKEDSDKMRWRELARRYEGMPSWFAAPAMAAETARAMQQTCYKFPTVTIDKLKTFAKNFDEYRSSPAYNKDLANLVKVLVEGFEAASNTVVFESNDKTGSWQREVDRINNSLPKGEVKETVTYPLPKPNTIAPGQVYRDPNGSIVSSQTTDIFVVLRMLYTVSETNEETWEIAQFPTYTNHGLGGAKKPERLFSKADIQKLQYIGSISDVEHPHYKIPPDLSKGLSRLQHLVPKEIPAGASITDWAADEIVRLRENLSQLEATRLFGK